MGRIRETAKDASGLLWVANGVDLNDFGLIDCASVNINEGREVRYWTAIFRCTPAQLHSAIAEVGTKPKWVKAHLRGQMYD
jgi:hypothetical protein